VLSWGIKGEAHRES